jgi:nitrite reductase/ring-hydroxylating ferredoxin subunit
MLCGNSGARPVGSGQVGLGLRSAEGKGFLAPTYSFPVWFERLTGPTLESSQSDELETTVINPGPGHDDPSAPPATLDSSGLKALREAQTGGISRRQLLGWSIKGAIALWLAELTAGTIGFLWPNLAGGFGGVITIGKITDAANNLDVPGGPPFSSGAPAHFPEAKLFIMLVDPSKNAFVPGTSADGNGTETNVRTLYQACTHLGCTPNFCPKNYWFECPCHGSRYDRLGTKVANLGPAPRSLDRFWSQVAADGTLTVDTGKLTLGPLPVALGQPGLIPPASPTGCLS